MEVGWKDGQFLLPSGGGNTSPAVYSSDPRLTDARTPTAHSSSHLLGGSDPLGDAPLNGFVNRTSSTLGMSGSTFEITTGSSYDFYSNGTKYTKSTTQSVSISSDLTQHFVYFDSSGVLQVSTSAWDIEADTVPVATVYKDGSTYIIGEERHGFKRNRNWHKWAHNTIGTRYTSGFAGTFTNTTLSLTQGTINDEDIALDSGGTKTTANLWYRNAGLTAMRVELAASTPYKNSAGTIQYDNAGTLTNVSNNSYVANYVYATNDPTTPISVIIGQGQGALATIRAEALPSILINTTEWKLLYKVIYRNQGGTTTFIESSDFRSSSSLPAGGTPASNAGSVTYAPTSPLTATNVQGALDQLAGTRVRAFGVTFGNGVDAMATGAQNVNLRVPYSGTITKVSLLADATGSMVVDIWKDTYANFPPTVADTITASAKPTLSSAKKYEDSTLTGWTTTVTAGDVFEFNIDSVTTIKKATLILEVTV